MLGDGTIVAVRPGKAAVTAYTPNMKTAKVAVTVKGWVTSLKLKGEDGNTVKTLALKKGNGYQFTPEFNEDASFTGLRWTSSKPAVAYITSVGKVVAVSGGTTKITATALDGSKKKATVVVTVTESD